MSAVVERKQDLQVVSNATSLIQAIERAASNPDADIEKMERLFVMHQKMVAQEAEASFNAAMARAQAKIVPVANNAANQQTNSRYAKLAAINKAITPIYTAEGLSISFDTGESPIAGWMRSIAVVSHAAGFSRQHHLDLPLDDVGIKGTANKTLVHASGSTNSYARRYLVCMIFNVTTEDDNDGNDPHSKKQSMGDDDYQEFVKRIEAQTTKEKAKEVCLEGVKACAALDDVDTANKLKAVLLAHAKFIDEAGK